MSNTQELAYQQSLEHQQYLLTKESFCQWMKDKVGVIYDEYPELIGKSWKCLYLSEHGLPLDSRIEGL